MGPLSEAAAHAKCKEAIRNHPNTRSVPLGPFAFWVKKLYLSNKEVRDQIANKNGDALADYICSQVEKLSRDKKQPWHRTGKPKDKKKQEASATQDATKPQPKATAKPAASKPKEETCH